MAYEKELEVARESAGAAASLLRRHYEEGTETWEKSRGNPVTQADLEADRLIGEHLRAAFPSDGLLSEESVDDASRLSKARAWIVDPMDGTREFTRRIPEFAVSIALVEAGEPVVGVVCNPLAEVTVWARRGGGTCRNGAPARISTCRRLEDALVIASRSELSKGKFEEHESWFRELRPMGSIAWKLACIASGEGDLNVSFKPKNEWDVCAGDLLVREAGGAYLSFDGQRRRYNQADPHMETFMAAGPHALVEAFRARETLRLQHAASS